MSNIPFYVPKLKDAGAWADYRGTFSGGFGWRDNISTNNYRFVAIHHSVTNPKNNLYNECAEVHNIHVGGNKWGGIGYNFIVGTESIGDYAKVAYVGDLGNMRAHTPNMKGAHGITAGHGNMYIIGICIIGRFDGDQNPTAPQLRSLHEIVKELIFAENERMFNLKDSWDTMKTHKDFDSTACAGQFDRYKGNIINPPGGSAPIPDDNLFRVLQNGVQKGAFKDRDNAFDLWYTDKNQKVTFNRNDITSEFTTMANKLEKEIETLKIDNSTKQEAITTLTNTNKALETENVKLATDIKSALDAKSAAESRVKQAVLDKDAAVAEKDKFIKSFFGQLYLLFNKRGQ